MFRKSTLIAGLSLIALTAATPVFAADPPTSQPTQQKARGERGDQFQNLLAQLNLTDDQKKQIDPIVEQAKTDVQTLMKDKTVAKEDRRDKMKTIMTGAWDKISAILTQDQKDKLKDLRQQQMSNRKEGGKKGPGGDTGKQPAGGDTGNGGGGK